MTLKTYDNYNLLKKGIDLDCPSHKLKTNPETIVGAKSLLNVSICWHFYCYEYKCRPTSSKKKHTSSVTEKEKLTTPIITAQEQRK